MSKETGGPAFPELGNVGYNSDWQSEGGMTLRDYFAGHVVTNIQGTNPNLPGMPASVSTYPQPEELAQRQAKWAYLVADAMLEARK